MKTKLFVVSFLLLAVAAWAELAAPKLSRDANGVVIISGEGVRYSLDNSDPGPKSGAYLAPIALARAAW